MENHLASSSASPHEGQPQPQQKIVILTGAGISKESGIQTFRGPGGAYNHININEVATPRAFAKNPMKVHDFYNGRRKTLLKPGIKPNAAHEALARLEQEWGQDNCLVITQNVDHLHEQGGSQNVIHLHGEILKARCTSCAAVYEWTEDITMQTVCKTCNITGKMRVHVVWFGEMPFELTKIEEALQQCDLFVSIGTSGTVEPASEFVEIVQKNGARTVELNLEPSNNGSLFQEHNYGPASVVVPQFVDQLLESRTV